VHYQAEQIKGKSLVVEFIHYNDGYIIVNQAFTKINWSSRNFRHANNQNENL